MSFYWKHQRRKFVSHQIFSYFTDTLQIINMECHYLGHQFGKTGQLLLQHLSWMMFCMSPTLVIVGYSIITTFTINLLFIHFQFVKEISK